MMKIAIVGHGIVGQAVDYGFNHSKIKKIIIDPKYGNSIKDISKHKDIKIIFVCVPTPSQQNGSIDSSIVENVVEFIINNTSSVVVIKSTITPDVIDKLSQQSERIVYNPEFLTEKNSKKDFINPSIQVYGGNRNICAYVDEIYSEYSSCKPCPTFYVTPQEASFIKYGINTFLATKVLWFNQFYDIINDTNASYDTIINVMKNDSRIGKTHMNVPGYEGKRGFGGMCFPKDTKAFLNYNNSFSLLKETIDRNNDMRNICQK